MKDSGVEWIGEIPEHWEVRKIRHLGSYSKLVVWIKKSKKTKNQSSSAMFYPGAIYQNEREDY